MAGFVAQMTATTKADGTAGGPYGPYVTGEIPTNPFNDQLFLETSTHAHDHIVDQRPSQAFQGHALFTLINGIKHEGKDQVMSASAKHI